MYFYPPKPAERKCRIGCKNDFPTPRRIGREKLFRYAQYGRPGVKTEYNENYRNWMMTQSKYDYISVSTYSQKELNKAKPKSDKEGFPCACFTGTFDGTKVEKLIAKDPYADEWFEEPELDTKLKTRAAVLHERPKAKKNVSNIITHQRRSETSLVSRSQSLQNKFDFINDHIKRHPSSDNLNSVSSGLDSRCEKGQREKKREAWIDNTGTQPDKKLIKKKNIDVLDESEDYKKIHQLYNKVKNLDHPIQRECCCSPPFEQSTVGNVSSSQSLRTSRSDSPSSNNSYECTTPVPSVKSEPNLPRSSAVDIRPKKENVATHRKKKLNKNLAVKKKKAWYPPEPSDERRVEEKALRKEGEDLFEEARREDNYPFMCVRQKDLKDEYLKDYKYWQAVDYADPPQCPPGIHEKQLHPKRAQQMKKKAEEKYQKENKARNGVATANKGTEETRKEHKPEIRQIFPEPQLKVYGKNHEDKKVDKEFKVDERNNIQEESRKLMEKDIRNDESSYNKQSVYDSTYKKWNADPVEQPFWKEKIFKSLGGGHWNLPNNVNEEWKKRMQQKFERERNTYQQEANRRRKDAVKSKPVKDPFLSMYYPDFRTTPAFISQYQLEYYHKHLPRQQSCK